MSSFLPVLLLALAGLLSGGAVSLHRQGTGRGPVVFCVVLAVLAAVGGVLWLM
jgi:hypothetical protein